MIKRSIALITVDGGGPRRIAKVGAVALAAATGAPLVAVGVLSRPAIVQPGKWDRTRIPVPFARVSVVIGESIRLSTPSSIETIEKNLADLQQALNGVDALMTGLLEKSVV